MEHILDFKIIKRRDAEIEGKFIYYFFKHYRLILVVSNFLICNKF